MDMAITIVECPEIGAPLCPVNTIIKPRAKEMAIGDGILFVSPQGCVGEQTTLFEEWVRRVLLNAALRAERLSYQSRDALDPEDARERGLFHRYVVKRVSVDALAVAKVRAPETRAEQAMREWRSVLR